MSILVYFYSFVENFGLYMCCLLYFRNPWGQNVNPAEKIALAQSHIVKGFAGCLL